MEWFFTSGIDLFAANIDSPYIAKMVSPEMKAELTKYAIICTFLMAMIRREQKKNYEQLRVAVKTLEIHLETIEKTFEGVLTQVKEFKGIFRTMNKGMAEMKAELDNHTWAISDVRRDIKEIKTTQEGVNND